MSANVIAIDGPAASGKSTAAKNLAKRLGIPYINTGSLYRAIAWKAAKRGIPYKDVNAITSMLKTTAVAYKVRTPGENPDIEIDGVFPGEELRLPETANGASAVATLPVVREFTLDIQRETAKKQLVVMEGRDIGTCVFPDAKYKFFLTASPRVRAMRRLSQGGETPDGATIDSVAAEIAARDKQDSERAIAPLKQADDAELIDSSELTQEQVLELLIARIDAKKKADLTASISCCVPYADTDQMCVVYYANYLVYFEMAREELLRKIGFSCTEMEKSGFTMPVTDVKCKYRKPAKFEDQLTITAKVTETKGVRMKIEYEVKRGEELLATGTTTHACMDTVKNKPCRMPQKLLDLLA